MTPEDEERLRRRGRAVSDAEKREILERLFAAWTRPDWNLQRLGQLIFNAARGPRAVDLFYVEDQVLVDRIERMARGEE